MSNLVVFALYCVVVAIAVAALYTITVNCASTPDVFLCRVLS